MRALVTALLAALPGPLAAQEMLLFTVGSGEVNGGYYAATRAICEAVNRAEAGRLRCSPEPTSGSLYNLAALADGQLDFALAQSDWHKHAVEGTSVFEERGPMTGLRSVMSLYPEPFNLIARRDAGIGGLHDLIGKRVDIGHPSSGRRSTMLTVLARSGIDVSELAAALELPTGSAIDELCAGRIDATALIIGHPSAAVARALDDCDAELVPLTGPDIEALIAEHDDYNRVYAPIQAYPSLTPDVPSFSVRATVVTLGNEDPRLVEAFVSDTLDALEQLRQNVPILAGLSPTP